MLESIVTIGFIAGLAFLILGAGIIIFVIVTIHETYT